MRAHIDRGRRNLPRGYICIEHTSEKTIKYKCDVDFGIEYKLREDLEPSLTKAITQGRSHNCIDFQE